VTYPGALAAVLIFLTGLATGVAVCFQYIKWAIEYRGNSSGRGELLRLIHTKYPSDFHLEASQCIRIHPDPSEWFPPGGVG
jgi:hypothetical protein